MSTTDIRPVSSKEHMLSPTDIITVAAYEYKDGLNNCRAAARRAHVTPERMSYAIMLKEYSDPRLIRLREGNTLFTIAALPHRTGFVRAYNGDTAENYINNLLEFNYAARKLGFDITVAHASRDVVRALQIALRRHKVPGVKYRFDVNSKLVVITTGKPRGE